MAPVGRQIMMGLRLARGSNLTHGPQTVRLQSGFTLLEMLVVLVIAGLLISLAALSITRNPRTEFAEEAQRLALLFESAANEAQVRAQLIAWEPTPSGYRFLIQVEKDWRVLHDDVLAPRQWRTPLNAITIRYAGGQELAERVIFSTESIDVAVTVTLYLNATQLSVASNGNGRYDVQENKI